MFSGGDKKQSENEKHIITELARKVQQQKQRIEELEAKCDRLAQEKERTKTLADIQVMKDISISSMNKVREKTMPSCYRLANLSLAERLCR